MKQGHAIVGSDQFIGALFDDYGIGLAVQRGVKAVDEKEVHWEDLEGVEGSTPYDFAMLIPRFMGVRLKFVAQYGSDITESMANPNGPRPRQFVRFILLNLRILKAVDRSKRS